MKQKTKLSNYSLYKRNFISDELIVSNTKISVSGTIDAAEHNRKNAAFATASMR